MGRPCWITGLALIWASVAVITIGTHLQTQSARFAEFELQEFQQKAGTGGEERLNPAGRMALALSFTWQFACGCGGFFACLFTAGVFGILAVGTWRREVARLVAGAFGLGCLAVAAFAVNEAVGSFLWGFVTLGVGQLMSAIGLCVGGAGVVAVSANRPPDAPSDPRQP